MRRRNERGAALIWAVGAITLVLMSVSVAAGALASQANSVRRMTTEAARDDLERAGRAWAKARLGRGALTAPETVQLTGGSIQLRPGRGWDAELIVQVNGERPGKPLPLRR